MKITRKQLRQIIQEELRVAVVIPKLRRQNDRKGFSSGIYEDSGPEEETENSEEK